MNVKSRHHLRSDGISRLEGALTDRFGIDIDADSYERVVFVDAPFEVVLADGDPVAFLLDEGGETDANGRNGKNETGTGETKRRDRDGDEEGEFAPTVRGANEYPPAKRIVTVDAGAISFVSDGANVMRPGIVEADSEIEAGDVVAIVEETHGKVLAIGRAAVTGEDMVGESGMVVESIHHVGDDLYAFAP